MTTGLDGSAYTYDAQNRLLTVNKNGVSMSFKYDGLNRQVSRTVSGTTTYSTWDGWNLVEEYTNNPSLVIHARYVYGPTGLVKELQNNRYYCQDGSGNTALLADSTAHLLEWYRYDLQGNPFFYNPDDTQPNPNQSGYNVRHLFTGQQWYQEIGLYDLRNRFYSPDIGRFLQPDPIRFRGDRTNLYRYCGNNPVTRWDPFGWDDGVHPAEKGDEPIVVFGDPVPQSNPIIVHILNGPWDYPVTPFMFPGQIEPFHEILHRELNVAENQAQSPSVQHSAPSSIPSQNPQLPSIDPLHATTPAEFIAIGNMIEHGNTMDTTPVLDPISLASGAFAARTALTVVAGTMATRAMWVGKEGLVAARASGATVMRPSQAALAAMRNGDMSVMQAESAAWARGAAGRVPVFFGNREGRIFLDHELPELLKNMNSGKVTEIDIDF